MRRKRTPRSGSAVTVATMSVVDTAMCCTPGAAVVVEVLVDLRLALALRRLVDRELHAPVAARHDLRHQRGVLRRDVLVGEVDELLHPEDVLVELHPLLHRAELDVRDDVVDAGEQAGLGRVAGVRDLGVARQERPVVAAALDEAVDRVAVGGDLREPHGAVLVVEVVGLGRPCRAARGRLAIAAATSGTPSAMTFTPSPWRRWCTAMSHLPVSVPVSTSRMRPCCRTCETRSRAPVSRPAYAIS